MGALASAIHTETRADRLGGRLGILVLWGHSVWPVGKMTPKDSSASPLSKTAVYLGVMEGLGEMGILTVSLANLGAQKKTVMRFS